MNCFFLRSLAVEFSFSYFSYTKILFLLLLPNTNNLYTGHNHYFPHLLDSYIAI